MTVTVPVPQSSPRRLAPFWGALRSLHRESLGFRFDYPLATVSDAGPRTSLHYYIHSDRLFFDAMQFDAQGIPVHRTRTFGPTYNPAYVSWYGLVSLERNLLGLDPAGRATCLRQVEWLVSHAERWERAGVVWPLNEKLIEGHCVLDPPWISAMVQGLAISLLIRGYRMTQQPELLALCLAATKVFELDVREGGVRTWEDGHPLYEEYPGYPLPRVLDGFLFSLLGLYDLSAETGDGRATELFRNGVDGLKHMLGFWNYRDKWSWYASREYLAPTHYNKLNAALLATVARLVDDLQLRRMALAWDPPRRTLFGKAEIRLVYFLTKNLCRLRYRTWRQGRAAT